MTKWTDHVKAVYAAGLKKDSNYKLKDAMKAASQTYKKSASASGKKGKKQMGGDAHEEVDGGAEAEVEDEPEQSGGKKKRKSALKSGRNFSNRQK